jgi:hypothetical protein
MELYGASLPTLPPLGRMGSTEEFPALAESRTQPFGR